MKTMTTDDGRQVAIEIPKFGMYRVSPETAKGYTDLCIECTEITQGEADEMRTDMSDGFSENRPMYKYKRHLLGMVIGENPEACMPEHDPKDVGISKADRRVVRWTKPERGPRFGDVVLFAQNVAVDFNTFWQLPCDTTPACEFLLCSQDETRWVAVSRQDADVTTVDLDSVIGIVKPFEESATIPTP